LGTESIDSSGAPAAEAPPIQAARVNSKTFWHFGEQSRRNL